MTRLKPTVIQPLDVYAASGLVRSGDKFYVVSDDELTLTVYSRDAQLQSYPLLPGKLPPDPKQRKLLKPDFEALVKHGDELLAIPSGSRENRMTAVIARLGADGLISGHRTLDLGPLYREMGNKFPELNIEGAVIIGEKMLLFQRVNGSLGQNGICELPLQDFLSGKVTQLRTSTVELGRLGGVALSFTDATLGADGRIYFLAVDEASGSTVDDGKVSGAILGVLDAHHAIAESWELETSSKPEGIAAGEGGQFFLVNDDDQREQVSKLWEVRLP